MALDPQLLDILACPEDKGPLLYFESESALYNPRLSALITSQIGTKHRLDDDLLGGNDLLRSGDP